MADDQLLDRDLPLAAHAARRRRARRARGASTADPTRSRRRRARRRPSPGCGRAGSRRRRSVARAPASARRTSGDSSTARWVVIAPSRSSPSCFDPARPGTRGQAEEALEGVSSRWLTRMPTNVPPATTVASSPLGLQRERLLERGRARATQAARAVSPPRTAAAPSSRARANADALEHPAVLVDSALEAAPALGCPARGQVDVDLEERERVRRLQQVLVGFAADLVRHDQPLDVCDESASAPCSRSQSRDDARRALRVQAPVVEVRLRRDRRGLRGPPGKWRSMSCVSAASRSASDASGSSSSSQSRVRRRCSAFQYGSIHPSRALLERHSVVTGLRLQQVQLAVGDRPLDVLRATEVLLERAAERRRAARAPRARARRRSTRCSRFTAPARSTHVVVRRHLARDDLLAETEDRLDDHPVAPPLHRIDGEKHTRLLRARPSAGRRPPSSSRRASPSSLGRRAPAR